MKTKNSSSQNRSTAGSPSALSYSGPVVLAILDGVGLSLRRSGNAVRQARTDFLDYAISHYLNIPLAASGEAVGLLPGQMGNSEVGHNTIGAGRAVRQGLAQVELAFQTGDIWQSRAWRGAMDFLLGPNPGGKSAGNTPQPSIVSHSAQNVKGKIPETRQIAKNTPENSAEIPQIAAKNAVKTAAQTAQTTAKAATKTASAPAKSLAATASSFYRQAAVASRQARARKNGSAAVPTLHFAGIFSDGGVHSDIKYLEQMIAEAVRSGVRRIRIHAIFDGRDVPPQSEPRYLERIEAFAQQFPEADIRVASGGGRMVMTADRYGNDWGMVQLGWDAMVHGRAPREFTSPTAAIATLRREHPGIQDQYLPAFVIVEKTPASSLLAARATKASRSKTVAQRASVPIGKISDGDALIYFDFRADRAVEIARAFTEPDFSEFKRGRRPEIYFAGLTEYDADRHVPRNVLVPTAKFDNTLNRFLGQHHLSQLAVSETVKFGHITYYFNGNSYKKSRGEFHLEIPSYAEPFNTRPWMKSAEMTDAILPRLADFRFVRLNFPGGDMVGHFAELVPTIIALESIDLQLARLAAEVDHLGGMMLIIADHGNAEELLDRQGQPKTAHTTNPVPCIFYDNTANAGRYRSAALAQPGLANLAATISLLLGLPDYPAGWEPPLIALK